jgi:hypothetical protein
MLKNRGAAHVRILITLLILPTGSDAASFDAFFRAEVKRCSLSRPF